MTESLGPDEQNVEYLRRLYANTLDWYKVADSKAELILTLTGAITVFGVLSFLKEPARALSGWPLYAALAALVVLGLAIYCAVEALHSNLSESRLRRLHDLADVDLGRVTAESPQVLCWFGMISTLSRSPKAARREAREETLLGGFLLDAREGVRQLTRDPSGSKTKVGRNEKETEYVAVLRTALEGMTLAQERRALSAEVIMLSNNVLQKHRWVNRGWAFCGLALVLALAATLLYWVAN